MIFEDILNSNDGVDKLIIAELRDGIKRFGKPRKSNVVPRKISVSSEVHGLTRDQSTASVGINIRRKHSNDISIQFLLGITIDRDFSIQREFTYLNK